MEQSKIRIGKQNLPFRQVLETLQLTGVPIDDKPHHMNFFISFPEPHLAEKAAEFLDRVHERAFGYNLSGATVQRTEKSEWHLIIGARMQLNPDVFELMERVAKTLAEMFDGVYDGWQDDTGFLRTEEMQQAMELMDMEQGEAWERH